MILPGRVAASSHRSHRSVLAALAPLVRQLAKGSHPSANEASMFTGASSDSKFAGKRILALAAVRHEKNSSLRTVQEHTQSAVKGEVNPGQASDDRSHFQGVEASGDGSHEDGSDPTKKASAVDLLRPLPFCRFIAYLFSVTTLSFINLVGKEQNKPLCFRSPKWNVGLLG